MEFVDRLTNLATWSAWPWKDIATSSAAWVGAGFGVYNALVSRRAREVRIQVIPGWSTARNYRAFSLEVINHSAFPVTIDQVGFLQRWSRNTLPILTPILTDGGVCPSDSAAVTFNQNPLFDVAPIARFERVAAMFDKLAADDQKCPGSGIHHWTVIEPEKDNHRASAGGRQVWRFQTDPPLRSNWVWWDPLSRSRRVRTIFICAVQITTLGYVTWMEIEGRDEGDVYTALIMPGRLADDEIITLIEAVRKKRDFRGVDFSKVLPKRPLPRLWKHQWENGTSELRSAPARKNILQALNS